MFIRLIEGQHDFLMQNLFCETSLQNSLAKLPCKTPLQNSLLIIISKIDFLTFLPCIKRMRMPGTVIVAEKLEEYEFLAVPFSDEYNLLKLFRTAEYIPHCFVGVYYNDDFLCLADNADLKSTDNHYVITKKSTGFLESYSDDNSVEYPGLQEVFEELISSEKIPAAFLVFKKGDGFEWGTIQEIVSVFRDSSRYLSITGFSTFKSVYQSDTGHELNYHIHLLQVD